MIPSRWRGCCWTEAPLDPGGRRGLDDGPAWGERMPWPCAISVASRRRSSSKLRRLPCQRPIIDLDDEARRAPDHVRLIASEAHVDIRLRQVCGSDQPLERELGVGAADP